jgi:hypothetical protein
MRFQCSIACTRRVNPAHIAKSHHFWATGPDYRPCTLFVAKRHDRIDKRRTASGDVAGQQRDQNEQGSNRNER